MRKGFTLIELMIVIAIIAIIAAIAIPGLLRARIASNERNAATSMKALVTAEENMKGNDVDRNGVGDYWTGDVAGLYCNTMQSSLKPVAVISDLGMVYADNNRFGADQGSAYNGIDMDGDGTADVIYDDAIITTRSPKAGYWYQRMNFSDAVPVGTISYQQITDAAPASATACHNFGEYGFCSMPAVWDSVGNFCFIVNQIGSVLRRDFGTNTQQIVVPGTFLTSFDVPGTFPCDWPSAGAAAPLGLSSWGKVE